MCGVIGFMSANDRRDMGSVATRLLRMLEYRGYDSTGAVIQDSMGEFELRKDVGSPTNVCQRMAINEMEGMIFCGQVRWATFGTVTRANAQPHVVACRELIYGAHNGNITNCDQLKKWLVSEDHQVLSDNDGEMLVHTVEHYFALELSRAGETAMGKPGNPPAGEGRVLRIRAFEAAIIRAASRMTGSFAAVVVDPVTSTMCCIKAGSSLYMGKGFDPVHGPFIMTSSDLASVLSMTKILLPIREKEFAIFDANECRIMDIRTGKVLDRQPVRSNLKVEETKLRPPFRYFMEQEIFAQAEATERLVRLFTGQSPLLDFARELLAAEPDTVKNIKHVVQNLSEVTDLAELRERAAIFAGSQPARRLCELARSHDNRLGQTSESQNGANGDKTGVKGVDSHVFESAMATFLDELRSLDGPEMEKLPLEILDAIFLLDQVSDVNDRISMFVERMVKAYEFGSSVYLLACGTSSHAAKAATLFFDRIAGINLIPVLPGEFRSQYGNSIRDRDVIIGISQSGETKDLIDVFNMVAEKGRDVTLISIVNNTNSSLAQEKSELYIPLFCGPEIAVPATKSFTNQLLVLYILALKLAERLTSIGIRRIDSQRVGQCSDLLFRIPGLIRETLAKCADPVESVANDLFMAPSIHVLATGLLGIAREGALKIREVVLNHTEGFEGSEFKHGPNTILGVNTIFGLDSVVSLMDRIQSSLESAFESPEGRNISGTRAARLFRAVTEFAFRDIEPKDLSVSEKIIFDRMMKETDFFESLYCNYPLIFVTGPSERDVNLTISQINTHKIRGTDVFIIAEENENLHDSMSKVPETRYKDRYRSGYITLPATGDDFAVVFTSTIALQLLAFRMSLLKLQWLDRLEIMDHGVHPDSPKNVSKSITVD
ncbi:MAG: glutamine--fructose-6-phosphate aminotransferase [Candidatus Wallbacteria bacterium HGW-Wallbacteria-1]|jgi:glucosamine 6-phosphate synthetase-like amidotransferase/phosphosugar isomerase protein|uniref:Glutamine--fructose-6-phosphate aminotransferase [isomerizing] n=1 Tax=Candidatus Wallbacteria bacterium HGW-Wallbacteria-1 TaxID=2013854 RepID=A0A2N1PMZ2_9BACT|nr:MAG: glutamine--fructose-6-phosphate aminotransferase [Candidatus Wallbacteria bacterium HGW-Wallbacteria-1]